MAFYSRKIPSYPKLLFLILCIGLALRLHFLAESHHLYHPDELFQSVELSVRLVYGFGHIPWDFRYGLRSFVLPFMLSPFFLISQVAGFPPLVGLTLVKIGFSLASLSLVIATYFLVLKITRQKKAALVSAFTLAIWYETVYFASRAFTENVSSILLALTVIVLLVPKQPKWVVAGFCMASAILIRVHYFIIPLIYFWSYRQQIPQEGQRKLLSGGLIGFLIFAVTDWITYGVPFIHLFNNLSISLLRGISSVFGEAHLFAYFQALAIATGGTILLTVSTLKNTHTRTLFLSALSVILIHSFIAHKEYRFILATIPMIVSLIAIGIFNLSRRAWVSALSLTVISILGWLHWLPAEAYVYPQKIVTKDSILQIMSELPNTTCGLYLMNESWVNSGGLTYVGSDIPVYTAEYPPTNQVTFNAILTANNRELPQAFFPVATQSSYTLYSRTGTCYQDGLYPTTHGFSYLTPRLEGLTQYTFKFLGE